ncbi:hypothetical protein KUTeg_000716 [Tegillarca granosa]|uniref:CULT domain-containing protein n=1 Tax=Tegillarca granosa TaxID=220873 RepID=A0ABQ9G2N0_TEGGR|nr:hypothetical protein KUTeg_000716 [Tegillarca granosa]
MVAPMKRQEVTNCCKFVVTFFIIYFASVPFGIFAEEFADLLLCRKCGHEVARASNVIRVPSKLAHRQRNDTVSGVEKVLIQLFKNPDGLFFEVITVKNAEVYTDSNKFMDMTWFPGYSWAVSVCPKCGSHIGWQYEVENPTQTETEFPKQFIGLIYEKLLEHLE